MTWFIRIYIYNKINILRMMNAGIEKKYFAIGTDLFKGVTGAVCYVSCVCIGIIDAITYLLGERNILMISRYRGN